MSYSYPKQIEFTIATRKTFLWTLGESSFAASVTKKSTKSAKRGGKKGENIIKQQAVLVQQFLRVADHRKWDARMLGNVQQRMLSIGKILVRTGIIRSGEVHDHGESHGRSPPHHTS